MKDAGKPNRDGATHDPSPAPEPAGRREAASRAPSEHVRYLSEFGAWLMARIDDGYEVAFRPVDAASGPPMAVEVSLRKRTPEGSSLFHETRQLVRVDQRLGAYGGPIAYSIQLLLAAGCNAAAKFPEPPPSRPAVRLDPLPPSP